MKKVSRNKALAAILTGVMCASMAVPPVVGNARMDTTTDLIAKKTLYGYAQVASQPKYNAQGRLIGYTFSGDEEKYPVFYTLSIYEDGIWDVRVGLDETITVDATQVVSTSDSKWEAVRFYGIEDSMNGFSKYDPSKVQPNIAEDELANVTPKEEPHYSFSYAQGHGMSMTIDLTDGNITEPIQLKSVNEGSHTHIAWYGGASIPVKDRWNGLKHSYLQWNIGLDDEKTFFIINADDGYSLGCESNTSMFADEKSSTLEVYENHPAIVPASMTVSNGLSSTELNMYKMYEYDPSTETVSVSYFADKASSIFNPDERGNAYIYVVPDDLYESAVQANPDQIILKESAVTANSLNTAYTYTELVEAKGLLTAIGDNVSSSFYYANSAFTNPKTSTVNGSPFSGVHVNVQKAKYNNIKVGSVNVQADTSARTLINSNLLRDNTALTKTISLSNGSQITCDAYIYQITRAAHNYNYLYSLDIQVANTTTNNKGEDVVYLYDSSSGYELEIKTDKKIVTELNDDADYEDDYKIFSPDGDVLDEGSFSDGSFDNLDDTNLKKEDISSLPYVEYETTDKNTGETEGGYIYDVDDNGDFVFADNSKLLRGDVDLDGKVDVKDVVLLQKYLLNTESINFEQFFNADMNEDGKANVFDLVMLKQLLLAK